MNFSDFILSDAIIADLKSVTKNDLIDEMVQALANAGGIPESEVGEVAAAVKAREELGSTGIGRGLAVPHAKHVCVDKLVGTVAICQGDGIDFNALDAAPVKLFFLLISPPDRPDDHLHALNYITSQLKDDGFVRILLQSRSREDVLASFADVEKNKGAQD